MPLGMFQPLDGNGQPFQNGLVYFYVPATTTFKTTWQDADQSTPNTNPVELDLDGRALIFGSGNYRQLLKDEDGNTIWDVVIKDPLADAVAELSALVPIGQMSPWGGTAAPTGWLLCYGQAISRTTYADLFAEIGTTFGVGDGSTTFNLPDLRGRAPFGRDDMGGSAANRITNAVSGITGTTLGAVGGSQALEAHTHGLFTTADGTTLYAQVAGSAAAQAGFLTPYVTNASSGALNPVYAGTEGAGASENMPPTLIMNYIIRTGV
jgi:microcystin-dependent protein